jgi:putative SOS response-associated peptidase YedK
MCGRFYTPDEFSEIRIRHGALSFAPAAKWEPNWNVAPTQDVLALRFDPANGRVVEKMYWGLIPTTMREKPKFPTFNARSETIDSVAAFRGAWRAGRRCAVITGGF